MAGESGNILVLEDDEQTQTLLTKHLSALGHRVSIAADGLAGLMQLERLKPDLIIIDIFMPRLNGMDFANAVRARDDTSHIPLMFLTANNDPRAIIDGINAGARYYVTKPFDINDLARKVERILQSRRR
jgi:DNA-binding response OmpR family regulator